jgi:exosome complex protein LRP1
MTSETENLKLKLQSLSSAFVDLEDQLALLFPQSLPETLVDLEPIQAAKLQTVLAYVVYDLIFSTYYSE